MENTLRTENTLYYVYITYSPIVRAHSPVTLENWKIKNSLRKRKFLNFFFSYHSQLIGRNNSILFLSIQFNTDKV